MQGACPQLGWLIPLLTVQPELRWRQVARAVIGEAFDRFVIWIGKANPALVQVELLHRFFACVHLRTAQTLSQLGEGGGGR